MEGAQHQQRKRVLDRMARAEGHFRSVRLMVEADRPCPEVLVQVAAIRAALDQIARLIFEDHLENCIVHAAMTGEIETELAELKTALARYFRS